MFLRCWNVVAVGLSSNVFDRLFPLLLGFFPCDPEFRTTCSIWIPVDPRSDEQNGKSLLQFRAVPFKISQAAD